MLKQSIPWIVLGTLALLTLCSFGCIKSGPPSTPTPDSSGLDRNRIMFEQAEGYYRNRFYDKALERYLSVVDNAPGSDYASPALYKIAGIYMKQGAYDKAILYFDRLAAEYPRSPYAVEAYYNKGYCFLKMGDADRAIDALEDYLVRGEKRHPARAYIYLAEAFDAKGLYDRSLIAYASAGAEDLQKKVLVEILADVKKRIDDHGSLDILAAALKKAKEGHVSDYLHYRIALMTSSQGNEADTLAHLKSIDFGRARFSFYKDANRLLAEMQKTTPIPLAEVSGPSYTIGVLLPLSGEYALFGEQVLHGIMLGADLFGAREKDAPQIQVIIRDSKADPKEAENQVYQLAEDPKVLAIIGPLMKDSSLAAVRAAQKAGIPIITLSTQENICDEGNMVFRNAMTLASQVKVLLKYAQNQKGCRQFALLHPDTPLGNKYAELFDRYLDPYKNGISARASYSEETTDFRHAIARIRSGGSFDAVFIPDKSDRIAMIAPQLVYFGVKGKVLLGTPDWNQDSLAIKAKGYLDDTVIVDSFFVHSQKPHVRRFVDRYEEDFGEPPTHLSGHGYDSIGILADRLKQGYGEGRGSLQTGLLGVRDYTGVAGSITVMENGDMDKSLTLLRVGQHGIEELF